MMGAKLLGLSSGAGVAASVSCGGLDGLAARGCERSFYAV